MRCDMDGCKESMDQFILVSCEVPPVRHEFVNLGLEGTEKKVVLDDTRCIFHLKVCLKHGGRILLLRTHGKRAAFPVATFGPLQELADGG